MEKREIVWKHDARRAECFHTISSFPIFTSVDITVYQYGKNVLYFFYNIAQRTLTEEWREIFRVDIVISTRLLANQRSEFTITNADCAPFMVYRHFSKVYGMVWYCSLFKHAPSPLQLKTEFEEGRKS